MSSFHRSQLASIRLLSAVMALLALAACESDSPQHRHAPPEGDNAAADKEGPEMEAHGTFFAGQIEVETLLNRAGFTGRSEGKDEAAAGGGGSGGGGSFGGGGGFGGGGAGGGGGRRHGGGSGGGLGSGTGDDGDVAPRIRPTNLPAVRLHLRLTNHGSAPVEVEVVDFDSDLGNFVVEPPKIELPPNKPVEAEPMTSRLGVSSDSIALNVSLRIGDRTDKQVLNLQAVTPAAPPSPAPNPAP